MRGGRCRLGAEFRDGGRRRRWRACGAGRRITSCQVRARTNARHPGVLAPQGRERARARGEKSVRRQ
ncbi:hypothetical protein E7X38_26615 [Streptomyces sp. Akac8]|nr:hypothetical protein E7X38_26615 [Streptomyces sp. Akac8]